MKIWTLWARSPNNDQFAPIEIASEAMLTIEGADPHITWQIVTGEAKADWPELVDWFTRVIDVADSAIINGSTASVAGAVVPTPAFVDVS